METNVKTKSRIIQAFEKFDHTNNNEKSDNQKTPIESIIVDKIKDEFESIRSNILKSNLKDVNDILVKYYITPSLKNDDTKQLYSLLKIDFFISDNEKSDDLQELKKALEMVKNKSSWEKVANEEALSQNYPESSHWFPYYISQITKKINNEKDVDLIGGEMVSLLFMAMAERSGQKLDADVHDHIPNDCESKKDDEFPAWFKKSIAIFQTYSPNLFNSAVYAYFLGMLLNRYTEAVSHKKEEMNEDPDPKFKDQQAESKDFTKLKVSVSKQFFNQLLSLVMINEIQFKLSKRIQANFSTVSSENSIINPHSFDATLLERVETYLLSGSNFKNPIKDWLINNQKPYNDFRRKLWYLCFTATLSLLRKHKNSVEFLKYIGFEESDSEIEWSFMDSIFNNPTEHEFQLLELLRLSFDKERKNTLELFTKTEDALNEIKQDNAVKKILKQFQLDYLSSDRTNKIENMISDLHDLVYICDKIDVDFTSFEFNFKKRFSDYKDCIRFCLQEAEKQHKTACKNDVYLAKDIEKNNIAAIKEALQYRTKKNVNVAILDIYQKAVDKIISCYYSEGTPADLIKDITEEDLIDKLNKYAFYKLIEDLNDEKAGKASSEFSRIDPLTSKEKQLFQKAEILFHPTSNFKDKNWEFCNNDTLWVCAGAGFATKYEDLSPTQIVDAFTKYLDLFCEVDCKKCDTHLDYCSKRFLAFGVIALLYLPAKKREAVIGALCKALQNLSDEILEENPNQENLSDEILKEKPNQENPSDKIKKRPNQQTLTILLNLLIVQPHLRLNGKTCRPIIESIYNRTLYPQQLFILNNIKRHPFLNSFLTDKMSMLEDPKLEKGNFPSPFCIYLYAAKSMFEEEERAGDGTYFKKQTEKVNGKKTIRIITNSEISIENTDDFYKAIVLLNGYSWQLANRLHKTKTMTIDRSVFDLFFEKCAYFWDTYENEGATNRKLKLTWATQLLITSFCNLVREGFLSEAGWDHTRIFSLSVMGDYTQKLYTQGYQNFLKAKSIKEADDFFILSSAMRYTSLLCKNCNIGERKFTFPDNNMIKNYVTWLTKEKNQRFLILTLRYLTFTDFFEKITSDDWNSIMEKITEKEKLLENPKLLFLPYDEITIEQLKYILKK